MSTQKNLITLCFAAVFTLGLAACGGGGNDKAETPPVVMPPVEMPRPLTSMEQLTAARDAVTAAQALVSSASTPTENAAAYSALAAAQAQLATAESIPENQIALHSQQGMVDEALTAAQAAVDGLSSASADDEVAEAKAAVALAQTALDAAWALPVDDSRYASVMGVSDGLGGALMMRTADMETEAINAKISTANSAVSVLDEVTSPGMAVADAREALDAATAAIAGATALTEMQKADLSEKISASNTSLTGIEELRATASGQLMVAEAALTDAQKLVSLLTPSSTAAEAAAAYRALGVAQAAIYGARNLPANQIATLQKMVDDLKVEVGNQNTASTQRTAVTEALADANALIAGLNDESSAEDVAAARSAVAAAQMALVAATDVPMDVSDNLGALISSLDTRLSATESVVADRPTAQEIANAAAATAAAGTKVMAIDAEAGQTPDAGVGGRGSVGADGTSTYTLTVARDRDGTKITITDIANPAGADPAKPQFAQARDLGGGRTMHVRAMDANDEGEVVEEVVIVSTDIDAPKATLFAMVRNAADGELTQELHVNQHGDDG